MKKFTEEEKKRVRETAATHAESLEFRISYDGFVSYYNEIDVKASIDGFKAGALFMLQMLFDVDGELRWEEVFGED